MGVEHVGQKSRLTRGEKEYAFSFDTSMLFRGSGQRKSEVYNEPVTCLQDQQWQIGAGRGSFDFVTWAVKTFALHKQCEVSVTVESFIEAIGRGVIVQEGFYGSQNAGTPLLLESFKS